MSIRVKICGITRVEDALAAAEAGADAIGLVFYDKSPRAVDIAQAWDIMDALPPFVTTVGLFVNADAQTIEDILVEVPLDMLQFHGDEPPEFCEQFAHPYLKAVRMRSDTDLAQISRTYAGAQGLLLDTYQPGLAGGTGQVFDWSLAQQPCDKPVVLAGGLTADNVGQAIEQVRPWAVDVSGGVEKEKGIKDSGKISAFIQAVKQAQ
jgi:phosphoribosylanthranilate isomerase